MSKQHYHFIGIGGAGMGTLALLLQAKGHKISGSAQLANEQTSITIAGAHGKTTTTSMVSCMLINAGLHPTTAVGLLLNVAKTQDYKV